MPKELNRTGLIGANLKFFFKMLTMQKARNRTGLIGESLQIFCKMVFGLENQKKFESKS